MSSHPMKQQSYNSPTRCILKKRDQDQPVKHKELHKEKQDNVPLYYSFMSAPQSSKEPAIIDSGACASKVGKIALDEALKELGIKKIEDDKISQPEHQFEPQNKFSRTLGTVRVPFICNISTGSEQENFKIRFDVIDGDLPFLIGLPSLRAMNANLNFNHITLSQVINNMLHRIALNYNKSQLVLPIHCKSVNLQ